jgi:hypothetical protein
MGIKCAPHFPLQNIYHSNKHLERYASCTCRKTHKSTCLLPLFNLNKSWNALRNSIKIPPCKTPWTPVWHCYMQQDRDKAEILASFSTFIECAPKSTTFQIRCILRCNMLLCFTKFITASSAHNWRVNISMSCNNQLTNLLFAAKGTWYSIYLTSRSKMVHGNRRHCCTCF